MSPTHLGTITGLASKVGRPPLLSCDDDEGSPEAQVETAFWPTHICSRYKYRWRLNRGLPCVKVGQILLKLSQWPGIEWERSWEVNFPAKLLKYLWFQVYNIMYYCWDADQDDRPSFSEIIKTLERLILTEVDYIQLDNFPDHEYYNVLSESGELLWVYVEQYWDSCGLSMGYWAYIGGPVQTGFEIRSWTSGILPSVLVAWGKLMVIPGSMIWRGPLIQKYHTFFIIHKFWVYWVSFHLKNEKNVYNSFTHVLFYFILFFPFTNL